MNTEEKRLIKFSFPFSQYFRQLFSADTYVRFINPFSFWRRYRIDHLETCRELDTVQYLESCYQAEWRSRKTHSRRRSAKVSSIGNNRDDRDTITNNLLDQRKLNTVYISQPRIKLTYRGVSYYTQDVLRMNIKIIEVDPSTVQPNNLEQSSNFCNIYTPEIFGSNYNCTKQIIRQSSQILQDRSLF